MALVCAIGAEFLRVSKVLVNAFSLELDFYLSSKLSGTYHTLKLKLILVKNIKGSDINMVAL